MRIAFEPDVLATRVAALASDIESDHPNGVHLIGVLNGSVLFLADLVRELTVPVTVDFLAVSSFAPDSGRVRLMKDLDADIAHRDVVLVEDVIDTGLKLTFLREELLRRLPASLKVCSLFDRTTRRIVPVVIDYVGFEVGDEFVVGYGLDYKGYFRNLPGVVSTTSAELEHDLDALIAELY
jgi:hypoxanthine phosphoribosyltransferase